MPPLHGLGRAEGAAFESRPCTNPRGWLDYGVLAMLVGLVAAPGGGSLPSAPLLKASQPVFGMSPGLN